MKEILKNLENLMDFVFAFVELQIPYQWVGIFAINNKEIL